MVTTKKAANGKGKPGTGAVKAAGAKKTLSGKSNTAVVKTAPPVKGKAVPEKIKSASTSRTLKSKPKAAAPPKAAVSTKPAAKAAKPAVKSKAAPAAKKTLPDKTVKVQTAKGGKKASAPEAKKSGKIKIEISPKPAPAKPLKAKAKPEPPKKKAVEKKASPPKAAPKKSSVKKASPPTPEPKKTAAVKKVETVKKTDGKTAKPQSAPAKPPAKKSVGSKNATPIPKVSIPENITTEKSESEDNTMLNQTIKTTPVKKSKVKIKSADLEKLKLMMLEERERILEELRILDERSLQHSDNEADPQPGFSQQSADCATENIQVETDLAIRSIEAEQLRQIDEALRAIEEGDYGRCQRCHLGIDFQRLKVKPNARFCVDCLRLLEAGKA